MAAKHHKKGRLKKVIERIRNHHPHHWKNAVWAWANKGKGNPRRKLRRFRAYYSYAEQHYHWAKDHGKPKSYLHELRAAELGARKKIAHLKKHLKPPDPPPHPQVGNFVIIDGRQVPAWMATWVWKIRARGNWTGTIVSGYRSPAYSTSLCVSMCGHPTCSGTCAGATSNHSCPPTHTGVPFEGAIDVSDYVTFRYEARAVGAPFWNNLPSDPVHFSHNGN